MTKTEAKKAAALYSAAYDCCARDLTGIGLGWVVTFYKRSYGIGIDCASIADVYDALQQDLITR